MSSGFLHPEDANITTLETSVTTCQVIRRNIPEDEDIAILRNVCNHLPVQVPEDDPLQLKHVAVFKAQSDLIP
jgi:hypothetical protein